jgi:hypothetical protein
MRNMNITDEQITEALTRTLIIHNKKGLPFAVKAINELFEKEINESDEHAKIQADAAAEMLEVIHKTQRYADSLLKLLKSQFLEPVNGYEESDWLTFCQENGIKQTT